MWNFANDEGIIRYAPAYIRSCLFPYKDISLDKIKKILEELSGFLTVYEVAGQIYAQIKNFKKHQSINHPSPSLLPLPNDYRNATVTLPPKEKVKEKEKEKEKEKYAKHNFELFEEQVNPEIRHSLQDKFPPLGISMVEREYVKAYDWLKSTGKTKKDYVSFFRNWLREAQERINYGRKA
jgi:NACalpha-BTF3-like transcription factor